MTAQTVADWFARRTHSGKPVDAAELARRKAEQGLTISVVLPARDEADTIEGVVRACTGLVGTLVDEVVVMDGGSRDGTPQMAAAAGARVQHDSAVLPELGPALGKGDALWRSLVVTSGDLVVFIDADIRNPDPRFVTQLLGPLLLTEEVGFVKAYYDRPLEVDQILAATGGGRVTELMARPLLNAFWPELAAIVQPLSGEYAGRRELLEAVPFVTGYGVELGLLIDIAGLRGVDAIAQVDLQRRVHRNQSLDALSRMAYAILRVALLRLRQAARFPDSDDAAELYYQFARVDQMIELTPHTVSITERPPLVSLPGRATPPSGGYKPTDSQSRETGP